MSEDSILLLMGLTVIASLAFTAWTAIRDSRQGSSIGQVFWKCLSAWVVCALLGTGIGSLFALDTVTFLSTMPFVLLGVNAATGLLVLLGRVGVRALVSKGARPAKDPQNVLADGSPIFESADEGAYTLLETDDTTVITWRMWQYGTMSEKNYGRFIEIKSDRVCLSEVYPLPSKKKGNQKEVTLELFHSDTWRSKAKVYDPQKISGLRIAQSKPRFGKPVAWNDTTFTVVMDYGKTHVDLNYQAKPNSEIGNFSDTDEEMLRLVAVLKEAIQRRRDQADDTGTPLGTMSLDELKALSEEHGIDVTFGDDPRNSTSPKSPPSSEGKKSTSDDPF